MRRFLCVLLVISVILSMNMLPTLAAETSFYLPSNLSQIEEAAFEGNIAINSIVIPKTVEQIGSRAFAGCTGLTDVYIGNNPTMFIAPDAFEGCSNVLFHVYPDSNGELFALAHGYRRELLESGSPAWERAMSMIGQAGFSTSYFNSPQWSTKRLIVRRTVDYLPDISMYNPIKIVEKGYFHIFIIQFADSETTEACHSALLSDSNTVYAEEDLWHETDTVTGAGIVDSSVWDTDDPMGFDTYAPFVKSNSSGTVKIAIIDSGVKNLSHYSSMLVDGKNMLEDIDGQSWSSDSANHGSVIASIIRDCVGNNSVRLIPIRVQGSANQFDDELLADGIDYAVEKGANIINLSMNFPQSSVVRDAINHAVSSGVIIVVAAGNDARNVSGVFPANMSNVVTVSGISPGYKLSTWSNFGAINYCAPDNYINTTAYSNSLKRYTSFAAPMIASAYALVQLDKNHSLPDMINSCILKDDPSSFGYGLPQLQKLAKIDPIDITIVTELPQKMQIGETIDLLWSIDPVNTTNQTVTPISSDTSVLDFIQNDGNITVKAVGQGNATITLTVNDSNVSTTSESIFVEQPVTNIVISGAPEKLIVGNTTKLNVMISPDNATTKTYTWYGNEFVSVSHDGTVTGISEGEAIIYAIADDGYGAKSNTVSFPVVLRPDAESVTLYIDDNVVNGQTIFLTVNDSKSITYSVSPSESEQLVTFSVLSGNAVTVSPSGQVQAVRSGTATVLGTASTGTNVKATVSFNVEVPETGVSVATNRTVLYIGRSVGGTATCTATVQPSNATYKTVTWSSSNPNIASVESDTGLVTPVSPGEVQIIATTHNGLTNSVTINIPQTYTLIFDSNGGTCETESVTAYSGEEIYYTSSTNGLLPIPDKWNSSGYWYKFKGWYTLASGGTRVTNFSKFTSSTSVTVYAQWLDMGNVRGGSCGTNTTWILNNGNLIISGSGPIDEFDEFGPTSYHFSPYEHAPWHDYMSQITSLTIQSGVTTASREMCRHARNLVSVSLPTSVTSIGSQAFFYCTSLTSITLSSNVTHIDDDAFNSCTGGLTFYCPQGSYAESFALSHGFSVVNN